ncbi:hypothetical protein F7725_007260 [Dissostichus mawsoni]|uniref:Uncharacterized protein n=1 Tax=Dissostichus mawsoni TaxID=36200 RepID=A0A7J5XZ65_DISMA|nr:hypothetical protein F7725_007260 [Dissostichus mawsoni]
METPSSSGKLSPESIRSKASPSESSEDSHDQRSGKKPSTVTGKREELSLYKKTKRAITSKKYGMSKHEAEESPIELISRGPDGRFVIDPTVAEMSVKPRRIEGFPFVEESDHYPEFRQSDEENDDPRSMPQLWPLYGLTRFPQSPARNPTCNLQPTALVSRAFRRYDHHGEQPAPGHGADPSSLHHRAFYGYLGHPGDHDPPPPFYMTDTSPLSSVMSSPPYLAEGPFGHSMIPEECREGDFPQYAVPGFPLPLTITSSSRTPEIWQGLDFTFASLEGPQFIFPPHHPLHLRHDSPYPPPPHVLPLSSFQPSLPMPTYPAVLPLEAPKPLN